MTLYEEITDWLFNQVPMFQNVGAGAYKPGLDNVLRLSEAFGNPHLSLKTVHIGGTNGKGSTSSMLASVFQLNFMKTGLFTSPHLVDFRERIRVDGEMIPEQEVIDFIERYRAMNLPFEPSFFELTTVMALDWFVRSGVDIAVMEVGLGGRLDSTNIITPLVSVITNISLDHTALLGHTEAAIAGEKAGIIKPGVPVVIGRADGDVRRVFAEKAAQEGAPVIFAQDQILYDSVEYSGYGNCRLVYHGTPFGSFACPLTADCQRENVNTVLHALRQMPFTVYPGAVVRGMEFVLERTGLMGRWTTLGESPRVICDTGHNTGGWQWLGPQLATIADKEPLAMVIGFVNDKDISG
ncbi:MAG: bifunctional folylpolyglutamate synthase/dihydrofolate synthase, partial [Muribaculaceae bacterium]|nr:bifunctional folylpolyglutamate synthase/dihydrofolate synthase [Muribaculaceae bacterium]